MRVFSERLGHANPSMTLSVYAHVLPGMQADAARQIADLIRAENHPTTRPAV